MKVSEAKEKVCPFMPVLKVEYEDMHNKSVEITKHKCICGDCMAWQFTDECSSVPEVDYKTEKGYCKRLSK